MLPCCSYGQRVGFTQSISDVPLSAVEDALGSVEVVVLLKWRASRR